MTTDPVCHMEINEKTAHWKFEYGGQTYYFCAPGCKASFVRDPEKYLGLTAEAQDHHHHH